LIHRAWSELFNNDESIEYLNLLDTFGLRSKMDQQSQDSFQKLLSKMQKGSSLDVRKLMKDTDFSNLTPEIRRATTVLKQTSNLPVIQKLLKLYGGKGADLVQQTQDDSSMFSQFLRSYGSKE
jgi:hypothetical protein